MKDTDSKLGTIDRLLSKYPDDSFDDIPNDFMEFGDSDTAMDEITTDCTQPRDRFILSEEVKKNLPVMTEEEFAELEEKLIKLIFSS